LAEKNRVKLQPDTGQEAEVTRMRKGTTKGMYCNNDPGPRLERNRCKYQVGTICGEAILGFDKSTFAQGIFRFDSYNAFPRQPSMLNKSSSSCVTTGLLSGLNNPAPFCQALALGFRVPLGNWELGTRVG